MAKNTTPSDNKQTTDISIAELLEELRKQQEINKALSEKVDILYKSGDKNKIRANTPRTKKLPLIKVTTFNDKVVIGWSKMTANKVVINNNGEHVEQRSVYTLSDGATTEEIEMEYHTFHSNKQMIDVEVSKIEPILDEYGEVEDTFYHFDYNGVSYKINTLFIN